MREEKAYTLREMTADDVFPMVKIISGIGLKEFKAAFEAEDVVLFSGYFGITREDWDAIKNEVPPMDLDIIKQKREQAFL